MTSNRRVWDAWTKIHLDSAFYDIESCRSGERPIRSKTTSARRATFVCANLYDLRGAMDVGAVFDIVYTSGGVLGWLPDLEGWARVVNLVDGIGNDLPDVFRRDLMAGTTVRVSVSTSGGDSSGYSFLSSISQDGRFVAFDSSASNLVEADSNGTYDIFVRDLVEGDTVRASVDMDGGDSNGSSAQPSISADGRFVPFRSFATDLVPGDRNGAEDVFVRDLVGRLSPAPRTGPYPRRLGRGHVVDQLDRRAAAKQRGDRLVAPTGTDCGWPVTSYRWSRSSSRRIRRTAV